MSELVKKIEELFSREGISELVLSEDFSVDDLKTINGETRDSVSDNLLAALRLLIKKYNLPHIRKSYGPIVGGTLVHCFVIENGNLQLSSNFWERIKKKTSNEFKLEKNVERQIKDFMRVLGMSTIKTSVDEVDLSGHKPKVTLRYDYPLNEVGIRGVRVLRSIISKNINDLFSEQISVPRNSILEPEEVEFNSNIRITLKNGLLNCNEKGILSYELYDDVIVPTNKKKHSSKLSYKRINELSVRAGKNKHSGRVLRHLVKYGKKRID